MIHSNSLNSGCIQRSHRAAALPSCSTFPVKQHLCLMMLLRFLYNRDFQNVILILKSQIQTSQLRTDNGLPLILKTILYVTSKSKKLISEESSTFYIAPFITNLSFFIGKVMHMNICICNTSKENSHHFETRV